MSLESKLAAIREASAKRIPEDKRNIIHAATERLLESGIMDRVAKVGDQLASFSLASRAGEVVRSADLLARGPLVITVFRGSW